MIENLNKGLCHRRLQTGEPPYFVNYKLNGENKYEFFNICSSMYTRYEYLFRAKKS